MGTNFFTKKAETPHKDTAKTRVEVKPSNLPKTTASTRVKLNSKQKASAPTKSQISKPTVTVTYEEEEYTPLRLEVDPIQRVTTSNNTRHQNIVRIYTIK